MPSEKFYQTRSAVITRRLVLRGLIGSIPPNEELEPRLERFRLIILRQAMEEEMEIEYHKNVVSIFGAFEQEPGGKIIGGSLTDSRRNAFMDLLRATRPFESWDRPEEKATPSSAEEERLQFLAEYKDWTENNGQVVATRLHYSDSKSRP